VNGSLVLAIDDSTVSPGVLGFLVVAALGVATWLLLRSMTHQMRKIDLPDDRATGDAAAPDKPPATSEDRTPDAG
jgi:hypothetical protein